MSEKNKEESLFFTFDATAGETAQLVGPLEENLRRIEAAFQIKIHRRGTRFTLTGARAAGALRVLELCAGRREQHGRNAIVRPNLRVFVVWG